MNNPRRKSDLYTIRWKVSGKLTTFRVGQRLKALPQQARMIRDRVQEDHYESIWSFRGRYYRYAGGGRGFYWTQRLIPVKK